MRLRTQFDTHYGLFGEYLPDKRLEDMPYFLRDVQQGVYTDVVINDSPHDPPHRGNNWNRDLYEAIRRDTAKVQEWIEAKQELVRARIGQEDFNDEKEQETKRLRQQAWQNKIHAAVRRHERMRDKGNSKPRRIMEIRAAARRHELIMDRNKESIELES